MPKSTVRFHRLATREYLNVFDKYALISEELAQSFKSEIDKAVDKIVNHFDYHATLLYLFGLDQQQVTFTRPAGTGKLVENSSAKIIAEILKTPPQSA